MLAVLFLIVFIAVIYFLSEISVSKEDYTSFKQSRSFKFKKVLTSDFKEGTVEQKYKYEFHTTFGVKNNVTGNSSSVTKTISLFPTNE